MKGGKNMREMKDKKDKKNLAIKIMAGIIILLILFITYSFIVKPQLQKYNDNRRLEGIEFYVLSVILPQLQQNGFVQIPIGNETLILVPYIPQGQPQEQIQEQVE
jgi:hypothetical protein